MLNIGLVGCGAWGRLILRDLVALGAKVTVVARGGRSAEAAGAGAAAVVDAVERLPRMDGYVVATPTSTHADVVRRLLPANAPIFCEKPLCIDAAEARALSEAAADRLFVMDKWRYHGGVLELARIARSGELGPVVGLRSVRVGWGNRHADVDCAWTLLPHELAMCREILGRYLPPVSAVADRGAAGVMGLTALSALAGGPWHVSEIGVRAMQHRRSIELLCRDGSAGLMDAYADHLVVLPAPPMRGAGGEPAPRNVPIPSTMPLLAELSAFLGHLRGGPPPKSSAAEAAEVVHAIAGIRRLAGI